MGLDKKQDYITLFEAKTVGCKELFISDILVPTGRKGTTYTVRDYVSALCLLAELEKVGHTPYDFSSKREALQYLHPAVRFRLKYFSPCLAYRYDELNEKLQEEIFNDPNWLATEKENGVRMWLIHYQGKTFGFSRNYSSVDCALMEYWGNIHQTYKPQSKDEVFAIDVEIKYEGGDLLKDELEALGLTTDTQLEAIVALLHLEQSKALEIQRKYKETYGKDCIAFRMIHPLYVDGVNYITKPLDQGQQDYDKIIAIGQKKGINLKPISRCKGTKDEKLIFTNAIIERGGEGVVFHNAAGYYNTSDNRDKTAFVKLKRSISGTSKGNSLGDTFDAFITGFTLGKKGTANENLVSTLELSIYMQMPNNATVEHLIARPSDLKQELMERLTITGEDGKPTLKPQYYGTVWEVDGQYITKKNQRIAHPKLVRPRTDKVKNDCYYSKEFVDSQIV